MRTNPPVTLPSRCYVESKMGQRFKEPPRVGYTADRIIMGGERRDGTVVGRKCLVLSKGNIRICITHARGPLRSELARRKHLDGSRRINCPHCS